MPSARVQYAQNCCLLCCRKKAVEDIQKTGRICILDVELNGVRSIRNTTLDAIYIVITAPDMETLVIFNAFFFKRFLLVVKLLRF